MTRPDALDLLQGTLDLLVLRTLQAGPLHGWAVAERIEQISQDVLQVNQGSLYPPSIAWSIRAGSLPTGAFQN